MGKPLTAFFDFACCEGCQLQVANLGQELLHLLGSIELVEFREIMSERHEGPLDLAIVEGSITTAHAVEQIRAIRERSAILVAYGSCATIGGVNGMKNLFSPLDDIRRYVYGEDYAHYETIPAMPVHEVVTVDYTVHGCPVYPPEFLAVVKAALLGVSYSVPDYPVCVECKLNENVCMFDRGVACLGPVTRAGCNSWCTNNGNICYGCRGMVDNPSEKAMKELIESYGITKNLAQGKFNMYNTCRKMQHNG